MDAGRDLIYGEGPGTIYGGPQAAYDDIIFGDHGAVIQQVTDPNLPDARLQKIQTTLLASRAPDRVARLPERRRRRRLRQPRPRRDRRRRRARHARRRRAGRPDLRRPGLPAPARRRDVPDRHRDRRHHERALPDALRHAALQPHRPPGRLPRRRRSPTPTRAASCWSTASLAATSAIRTARASTRPVVGRVRRQLRRRRSHHFHDFDADLGDHGAGSFGNDYIAGGAHHDLIFGQLGNDTLQGDGGIERVRADGRRRRVVVHVGASRTPDGCVDAPGRVRLRRRPRPRRLLRGGRDRRRGLHRGQRRQRPRSSAASARTTSSAAAPPSSA